MVKTYSRVPYCRVQVNVGQGFPSSKLILSELYPPDAISYDFSSSDLTCSDLTCSDLTCSDFTCSDLTCFELTWSNLRPSDLIEPPGRLCKRNLHLLRFFFLRLTEL